MFLYRKTPRPGFNESLIYYLDNELQQLEKAIRNIREAIKTAEDRLTAGGL